MGASKRLAEMVCQALQTTAETRFVMVRFGNVLGSAGSVIPKFRQQIAEGGPVTVTHPDITRYFMSIPEAAQLVLQAGYMGSGGEIFVLDMGEPVRIVDLVRNYAAQLHLDDEAVAIRFTGLRPGEKISEDLFSASEERIRTAHPRIWATRPRVVAGDLFAGIQVLADAAASNQADEVRSRLADLVPGYRPVPGDGLRRSLDTYYPDGF
jgi:FlaA1/EpsC-like NDP-sugar epimerase